MKNKLTLIAPAVFICWCFIWLQGCKDPVLENTNLLTKGDNLNLAKDTLAVTVVSQFEQPLPTNGILSTALGSINDPNFGTTYGSFYAQCGLTTNSVFFGIDAQLDSAVLTLAYNGYYGPCNKPINIAVYEMSQPMVAGNTYYTNSSFAVKTPAIGTLNNFVPNFFDSVYVNALGFSLAAHMRIPLTPAFGNRILSADSNELLNDSTFADYFKGLYVTTTSATTGNGMMYINIPSALSGINLYYRYKLTDTSTDYVSGAFYIPFIGTTANHFENNYYGTPVYSAVHAPANTVQQKIYLQGGAGVRGKINFSLDSLAKAVGIKNVDSLSKVIAINKAELIVAQAPGDTAYPPSNLLDLLRIDDAGNGKFIDDASTGVYGGVLVTETVDGVSVNRYHFYLTRYFQKLIQHVYNNNGMFLQVTNEDASAERLVVANASTDKKYKITLVVTFTKL